MVVIVICYLELAANDVLDLCLVKQQSNRLDFQFLWEIWNMWTLSIKHYGSQEHIKLGFS